MFGHYPVASETIAESGTVVNASVTLAAATSTATLNALSLSTNNNFPIASVVSTTTANTLGLSVGSSVSLTGVVSSGSVGSLGFFQAKEVTGVVGTSSVGTLTVSAVNNVAITGVEVTASLTAITPIDDTAASPDGGVLGSLELGTITAKGVTSAFPTTVVTTSNINSISATGTANPVLDTISPTLVNSTLDFQAKSSITLSSVTSSTSVEPLPTLFVDATAFPTSVFGLFSVQIEDPTAVVFDYEAVASALVYRKESTVIILPAGLNQPPSTIVIQPENFTVTIESVTSNSQPSTVFIPAQNFTVSIEPYRDFPKTVFITN